MFLDQLRSHRRYGGEYARGKKNCSGQGGGSVFSESCGFLHRYGAHGACPDTGVPGSAETGAGGDRISAYQGAWPVL